MLNQMNQVTEQFLTAKAEDLHEILKTPTLFHLDGINPQPLFICTLLHGNETTGFYAVQRLLNKYKNETLPRSISLFIGNIKAAKEKQRHLDEQDDYNRIWPGTHHGNSAEKDMVELVTHIMRKRKPFASIDIHNNTGKNPHYACINILNPHGLVLASKFSDSAVYFTSPKGVQSAAFSDFCPSVVLECGQSGDVSGVEHAQAYLESILELEDLSSQSSKNLKLYHTVARVLIPREINIGNDIDSNDCDICLSDQLDDKNFNQLQSGTELAAVNDTIEKAIIVSSESDEDVTEEYIENVNNKLRIKKPVTLAMYTRNEKAIRQDCVCYFMEELRIG